MLLGGSIVELRNSSGAIEFILSITSELLIDTDPNCKVQFRSMLNIQLQIVAFSWWPFAGVIQLVPRWAHIPCVHY